ncbi:MAG TPA: glycosyltransferase [Bryobacteraceae bacterium]|jgi:glycosyltransferase involved in cell wall biosynthesis|nr:glycosyltransferase [Bryobacteraceae bacterium]
MPLPDISVVIPARNEGARVGPTIQSIARTRTTNARLEFVIVDDASTDDTIANLVAAVPDLLKEPRIDIQVQRLEEQEGIYRARNHAAHLATAEILFGTDAHVRFSDGWDEIALQHTGPNRILSGTTVQQGSPFRGYGCDLLIPFMGTSWNNGPVDGVAHVPVAPCHATVMTRELFNRLGGYDSGMILYGAGEPELSVRAWLHGADVMVVGDLLVEHEFKPKGVLDDFINEVRPFWVHNCIRFGCLYLSELGCMQMMRYYSLQYPEQFPEAMRRVNESDVWQRRTFLEGQQQRSFQWLVDYFGMKDQAGGEIL